MRPRPVGLTCPETLPPPDPWATSRGARACRHRSAGRDQRRAWDRKKIDTALGPLQTNPCKVSLDVLYSTTNTDAPDRVRRFGLDAQTDRPCAGLANDDLETSGTSIAPRPARRHRRRPELRATGDYAVRVPAPAAPTSTGLSQTVSVPNGSQPSSAICERVRVETRSKWVSTVIGTHTRRLFTLRRAGCRSR